MNLKVHSMNGTLIAALERAKQSAQAVANSGVPYTDFVERIRKVSPWRFENMTPAVLDRDYLRVVDHHLVHLLPRISRHLEPNTRRVLDFGCGSGGSAISLALVYPDLTFTGTDIEPDEVETARERARLYGVADRCEFHCSVSRRGAKLPFSRRSRLRLLRVLLRPRVCRGCGSEEILCPRNGPLAAPGGAIVLFGAQPAIPV